MDFNDLISKLDASPTLEEGLIQNAAEVTEAGTTQEGLDALDAYFARKLNKKPVRKPTETNATRALGERQKLRIPDDAIPGVDESDGKPVVVYNNEVFENWGGTVNKIYPAYTFVPRTRQGVVNVVKFAGRENLRVRCSGSRHSWTDIYGASGEVLLSMMPLDAAEARPGKLPESNPQDTPLESVELISKGKGCDEAFLKVGASTTSAHVLNWFLSKDGGDWRWMLLALPILVEITSAGWTQPICHGAGVEHPMVPDFVTELEFVNAKGEIQTVSDPAQLRAAAGSFGMCGVILSQTFRLSKLRLAEQFPRDIHTVLAVPPPTREDVPKTDDFSAKDFTDDDLANATEQFKKDTKKFYSEWFWFPFQRDCWINCWDTTAFDADTNDRPEFLGRKDIKNMNLQAGAGEIFQKTALRLVPPLWQAKMFGALTMKVLPNGELIRASVCDALHFRRGVHIMEVLDFEVEIAIPRLPNGELDLLVVQKAWWMGINAVYREEKRKKAPMRIALEMRITGGSEIYMAPQYGNEATCAIEVLTNPITNRRQWDSFIQTLMNEWSSLTDTTTGESLKVLPHWAKEWPRKIKGQPTKQFLREAYKDNATQFKKQLTEIAKAGGHSYEEMVGRFGNDNMLEIIGSPNQNSQTNQERGWCCVC